MNKILCAMAASAVAVATGLVLADPMQVIVVEATAPAHHSTSTDAAGGGASVDLLSVQYHVHVGNLDLNKPADMNALQQKVQEAAQKACGDIQKQYPARSLSDEKECVDGAVKRAMGRAQKAAAGAQKKPAG